MTDVRTDHSRPYNCLQSYARRKQDYILIAEDVVPFINVGSGVQNGMNLKIWVVSITYDFLLLHLHVTA